MVISEVTPQSDIRVAPDGALTPDTLASFTRAFAADRTNRVLRLFGYVCCCFYTVVDYRAKRSL